MRHLFSLIAILTAFTAGTARAQVPVLSEASEISLLTCGPGPEIYSYFGHSALRVSDPAIRLDRVYNYGTFDFNVPDFYQQFIDGKLYYLLSTVRFQGFLPDYISENRFIKELTLNLPEADKQELFTLLEINSLPENRHYWYDFFRDNCSSRIRDILVKATANGITWPAEPEKSLTYRQLIKPYIGLSAWAKTGILLLLTAGADVEATQYGYMFLPDHLHRLFAEAKLADGTPLCQPEKILFMPEKPKEPSSGLVHPYVFFSLILVLSWYIALKSSIGRSLRKGWLTALLAVSGLLGILFGYMWFFSGHQVCHGNLNLAWAVPLNLIAAVLIWIPKAKTITRIYCRFALVLLVAFLVTFAFWHQRIPLEGILFSLSLVPGLALESGLYPFRKAVTDDQAN